MEFASSSSRFSREEDEDEEQEEEDDEEVSPREIPFMTAAATADTGAASSSSSPSPSAAASASASGSAAALRSSDGAAGALGSGDDAVEVIEKEHMFDKVVTPSDVGKLNRLVIPKQHAEKYFPLDAAANERGRGLLLSFEDRAGKLWRFRYSYWNSSQSYVMTKGWSRFVKEKRLDAGDTVSFCRGAADAARDRLFIDWRKRRADTSRHPHPRLPLPVPPLASPYGYGPWGGGAGGFFVPPAPPATLYEHHRFRQALDFRNVNAAAPARQLLFFGSAGMPPRASMPPPPPPLHSVMMVQPSPAVPAGLPMLLDSVPLVNSPTAAAKRVRLFGVNLDNPQPGSSAESSQDTNALSLRMPGWQRPGPLRFFESPQRGAAGAAAGAESSAASSPSSSSSSKREAHSSVDLDL